MSLSQLLEDDLGEIHESEIEVSPTVLEVDSWGLRKGRELWESRDIFNPHGACSREAWADCHAAVFEPRPRAAKNPADAKRAEWFRNLMQTNDYRALHKRTRGNLALSRIAAGELAQQWLEFLGNNRDINDPVAVARSVGCAVASGREGVNAALEAMEGLEGGGLGGDGSDEPSEADADRIVDIFRKTRNDSMLRKILESSGRFRRVAQSLQRSKSLHGCDDMVGVTIGNKIPHLCLSEKLALASEETELLALYRIANSRAMIKEYQAVEPQGRGPIVVVVDESGSMTGEKIVTAKGLALAMGWVAKKQRRWIAFVGFAEGTSGNTLVMSPDKWDQAALIAWLTHFYGGGTTLDVPVREIPETYWPAFISRGMPRGKTDIVTITDAVVNCPDWMADRYNRWRKEEKVTSFGIVLADCAGDFSGICDKVFCCRSLDVDGEAVREVLSV